MQKMREADRLTTKMQRKWTSGIQAASSGGGKHVPAGARDRRQRNPHCMRP